MWQILLASFSKFSKLSNSGISLNWSITDKVTTRSTTAYFFRPTLYMFNKATYLLWVWANVFIWTWACSSLITCAISVISLTETKIFVNIKKMNPLTQTETWKSAETKTKLKNRKQEKKQKRENTKRKEKVPNDFGHLIAEDALPPYRVPLKPSNISKRLSAVPTSPSCQ